MWAQHGHTRIRRVFFSSKLVMMSSMMAPLRTAHALACLWYVFMCQSLRASTFVHRLISLYQEGSWGCTQAANADSPQILVLIYAGLGDKDRAFDALERMAAEGPGRIGQYLTYPELASLRGDPRLKTLRRSVGLPQ